MLFRNSNREKGGFIFHRPRGADVARRADVTRGVDMARGTGDGCDAACKAMWQSRASPRDARWRGHVVGGHASPRGHPGGATWQEG